MLLVFTEPSLTPGIADRAASADSFDCPSDPPKAHPERITSSPTTPTDRRATEDSPRHAALMCVGSRRGLRRRADDESIRHLRHLAGPVPKAALDFVSADRRPLRELRVS